MVVDDEARHRALIFDFLHPLGFIVHMAESADQALEMLKEHSIDLFLLDLSMPETNGWELLETIRKQGDSTPVIILSASPYEDINAYQKQADFQAYINKPVRLEKLLEQIHGCINLRRHESTASTSECRTSTNHVEAGHDITAQEPFTALREYANIGYLKGVFECIESVETQHAHSHLVSRLRELADICDLNGIVRVIDELEAQPEPC
jgi:CheY-like chemotaxis protein